MSFLRRLGCRAAPEWASFMTGGQYTAFTEALAADMGRGWTWRQVDAFVERLNDLPPGPDR